MARRTGALLLLLAALAAGCGETETGGVGTLLPPASLGRTVHASQMLTAVYDGQSWTMPSAIEATPQEVRLVGMSPYGQRLISLRWNGTTLHEERNERFPERILSERILGDLQLIYWPYSALRTSLPADWHVEETKGARLIFHGDEAFASIRCDGHDPWQSRCVFEQHHDGYRLIIESTLD